MKFGLNEASAFKSFFQGISDVADEITFYITETGLRGQVTSRSGVMIFDVTFKKDYFDVYDVDSPDYIKLVPVDILSILKTVKNTDYILFEVDAYEMHILVEGSRRRNFNLSLIDDYDSFRDIPSLDYSIEATASLDDLLDSIKDLDLMGSPNAVLESKDGGLRCTGDNSYKGSVVLTDLGVTNNVDGGSQYGKSSFKQVLNFKNICDEVKLCFGVDYPLQCTFEGLDVVLTTMVAPILNNGEE